GCDPSLPAGVPRRIAPLLRVSKRNMYLSADHGPRTRRGGGTTGTIAASLGAGSRYSPAFSATDFDRCTQRSFLRAVAEPITVHLVGRHLLLALSPPLVCTLRHQRFYSRREPVVRAFAIACGMSLTLATISFRYIEVTARRWLRDRFDIRRPMAV